MNIAEVQKNLEEALDRIEAVISGAEVGQVTEEEHQALVKARSAIADVESRMFYLLKG